MTLQPIPIYGSQSGLVNDKKPYLIPDTAFSTLENGYIYRERTVKRQGLQFLGRLRRLFTSQNYFLTGASPWTFNLLVVNGYVSTANNANPGQVTTTYPHGLTTGDTVIITGIVGATGYNNVTFTITVTGPTTFTIGVDAAAFGAYVSGGFWISNRSLSATQPNAQIVPGSVVLTISAGPIVLTDQGNGLLTSPTPGNFGYINYSTGSVTVTHTAGAGIATTISYGYYPALPVMGIRTRLLSAINDEQTIFFDTVYAYIYSAGQFSEFIPGTVWDGSDSDFFWSANYPAYGVTGNPTGGRIFFVTNNSGTAGSPPRYTDGTTWTTFQPALDGTNFLIDALIFIPYYGRLLALNTTEGPNLAGSINLFNRCRFSKTGSATGTNVWRSDIVGNGGFVDAPTNEAIVSAAFVKNTLVVFFEDSTWQLRYIGNYGTPFYWERINSEFGSESTFSTVIFDKHALTIGSRAIVAGNGIDVDRIDLQIPDQIFDIQNTNQGVQRVQTVRDFQKELVYWCYPRGGYGLVYPSFVLVYNYRNNTYSIFRDNVTAMGLFQLQGDVTWDSADVTWDQDDILWDNSNSINLFPEAVSGNQQGYVHIYNQSLPDEESISISTVTITGSNPSQTLTLTSPNNNLVTGDFVMLKDMQFINTSVSPAVTVSTDLNNQIFLVSIPAGSTTTINLLKWAGSENPDDYDNDFYFLPTSTATFVSGEIVLLPKLNIITRDFNPSQQQGKQVFISRMDLLLGNSPGAVSVDLYIDSAINESANIITGNQEVETSPIEAGVITNATQANPCVITSPGYSLENGDSITINNIVGMTQLNGNSYTITEIDTDSFSINVDSTAFTAYVSNGIWQLNYPTFFTSGVASDYLWHSFYATAVGQYIRIGFTYDNTLMNQLITHYSQFELNSMNLWLRPAGKLVF